MTAQLIAEFDYCTNVIRFLRLLEACDTEDVNGTKPKTETAKR